MTTFINQLLITSLADIFSWNNSTTGTAKL